jgi:hypothetical protein
VPDETLSGESSGFSPDPSAELDPLGGKVTAPWTTDQVESLNGYQHSLAGHPYTCPRDHDDVQSVLVARENGWRCGHPGCTYTQDWAFRFMADWSWKAASDAVSAMLAGKPESAAELDPGLPPRAEATDLERALGVAEYRKTATVKAAQFKADPPGNGTDVARWCRGEFVPAREAHGGHALALSRVAVYSVEGPVYAFSGDWVCRGGEGEHWVVESGRFAATYVRAGEPGPLAERIDRALQGSIDNCARCKTCEHQVAAVLAVLGELPALTSAIGVTRRTGEPLRVSPEAAEAIAEAGLFVGSAEDARVVLSAPVPAGTFSDEVIAAAERLAQAAGITS